MALLLIGLLGLSRLWCLLWSTTILIITCHYDEYDDSNDDCDYYDNYDDGCSLDYSNDSDYRVYYIYYEESDWMVSMQIIIISQWFLRQSSHTHSAHWHHSTAITVPIIWIHLGAPDRPCNRLCAAGSSSAILWQERCLTRWARSRHCNSCKHWLMTAMIWITALCPAVNGSPIILSTTIKNSDNNDDNNQGGILIIVIIWMLIMIIKNNDNHVEHNDNN